MSARRPDSGIFVDVKRDHGAVGDGVTDDTAAIQAAIDALEAGRGGTVYFPRGLYIVTGTLVAEGALQDDGGNRGGIEFVGEGIRGSVIEADDNFTLLEIGATYSKMYFRFADLTLRGQGSTSGIGIDSRTTGGSYVISNVAVHDFGIGIRYYDNTLVDAHHLTIWSCGIGLAMGTYSDSHSYTACRIDSCDIGAHIGYADTDRSQTVPTESHAITFLNTMMNLNGVAAYVQGAATEAVSFLGCYIEQYSDVGIRLADSAYARTVSAAVIIDNCFFNGNRAVAPTGKVAHAIEVNRAFCVEVRGGGFRNHTASPVNVRHNDARVLMTPGLHATSSGESGGVKLPDASYVVIGSDRPVTIGRRAGAAVNFCASLPTASVAYDGCVLRVAGVSSECGSDGAGGYAWYAMPTAAQWTELLAMLEA